MPCRPKRDFSQIIKFPSQYEGGLHNKMRVTSVDFFTSVYDLSQLPDDARPEIAFVGRSNVGKSSFINTLVGRKKLAQISKNPGRTRSINFYLMNDSIYLVDLPGYGYAKVPINVKREWKNLIEGYLSNRPTLKAVAVLFDIRRLPQDEDISLLSWFKSHGIPIVTVLSKADKLSSNKRLNQLSQISRTLSVKDSDLIAFSAVTGEGREAFWQKLIDCGALAL